MITLTVDVTVPAGVLAEAVTNPFAGSPSPCAISTDTTCASASYTYIEDEVIYFVTRWSILSAPTPLAFVTESCSQFDSLLPSPTPE